MAETPLLSKIMLSLGGRTDVRIFRNNVGNAFVGNVFQESQRCVTLIDYRRIKFGLEVGSSDLIGLKSITITPDMVGRKVAVFLSPEIKVPGKNPTPHQRDWQDMVLNFGGIAGTARSIEDAQRLVGPEGVLPALEPKERK